MCASKSSLRLNATAVVRPRVRNSVVTIPIPQASPSTVIPIPTDQQKRRTMHTIPKNFSIKLYVKGGNPLNKPPLQRLIAKATAVGRPRDRNSVVTSPRPQASPSTAKPIPTDQQNNSAVSIPGIVAIISALRAT